MQLTVEINRRGKDNIIMSMSLQLGICGGLTLAIHCHQSLSVCSAPQSITRGLGWKGPHAHLVPTPSPRVFSMLNSPSSLSLSIGDVLQLSDHLCVWLPLYLLWYVHVSLVLRTPQLGTAAQLGCHEGRVPSLDLLAGLLLLQPSVPECALVGSYVALHPQEPLVLLCRAALNDFFSQPCIPVWVCPDPSPHLVLALVELHEVLMSPFLKFFQVPLDVILSFCCVSCTTQLL